MLDHCLSCSSLHSCSLLIARSAQHVRLNAVKEAALILQIPGGGEVLPTRRSAYGAYQEKCTVHTNTKAREYTQDPRPSDQWSELAHTPTRKG